MFRGRHLPVSYLRPSGIDAAKHAWAVLSLLAGALRARWPKVQTVLRGDSGFCRRRMLRWCEDMGVGHIVGVAKNKVLMASAAELAGEAERRHGETGRKQKLFGSFGYAAGTLDRERRVVVKAEHNAKGDNTRFVVTNLPRTDRHLYTRIHCARGEMENRIKNRQLDLFADRASCTRSRPNRFRQMLSGLAYTLVEALRSLAFASTRLAAAGPTWESLNQDRVDFDQTSEAGDTLRLRLAYEHSTVRAQNGAIFELTYYARF